MVSVCIMSCCRKVSGCVAVFPLQAAAAEEAMAASGVAHAAAAAQLAATNEAALQESKAATVALQMEVWLYPHNSLQSGPRTGVLFHLYLAFWGTSESHLQSHVPLTAFKASLIPNSQSQPRLK